MKILVFVFRICFNVRQLSGCTCTSVMMLLRPEKQIFFSDRCMSTWIGTLSGEAILQVSFFFFFFLPFAFFVFQRGVSFFLLRMDLFLEGLLSHWQQIENRKSSFWPGLGLQRPKAIVVIPKNQPMPKHLRKKRVKVRSTLPLRYKKDPLK